MAVFWACSLCTEARIMRAARASALLGSKPCTRASTRKWSESSSKSKGTSRSLSWVMRSVAVAGKSSIPPFALSFSSASVRSEIAKASLGLPKDSNTALRGKTPSSEIMTSLGPLPLTACSSALTSLRVLRGTTSRCCSAGVPKASFFSTAPCLSWTTRSMLSSSILDMPRVLSRAAAAPSMICPVAWLSSSTCPCMSMQIRRCPNRRTRGASESLRCHSAARSSHCRGSLPSWAVHAWSAQAPSSSIFSKAQPGAEGAMLLAVGR
mmetsp:Transcript_48204/g.139677  ORF Transcript_48204/g.139677 Transcript_48204/m.139677 type:complete len:266 (-) Transcript_48204:2228-3025(-)